VVRVAVDPAGGAELVGAVVRHRLREGVGRRVHRDQSGILDVGVDRLIHLALDVRGLRDNETERRLGVEKVLAHGGLLSRGGPGRWRCPRCWFPNARRRSARRSWHWSWRTRPWPGRHTPG